MPEQFVNLSSRGGQIGRADGRSDRRQDRSRAGQAERQGFGGPVIARALRQASAESAHLDWRPEDLVCRLDITLGGGAVGG